MFNSHTLTRLGMLGAATVAVSALTLAATTSFAGANDRVFNSVCVDQNTGAWEGSVVFSSINVLEGQPVQVSFGDASTTLTQPGQNGTTGLSQHFDGGQTSVTIHWSVVRPGYINQGDQNFTKPEGCVAPPETTTTAPPTTAPGQGSSTSVATTPSTTTTVATPTHLPETGRPTMPMLALGAGALIGGLGLVGIARRRHAMA